MPMQKRVLGPVDARPLPKQGLPEAVIADKDMRSKVVDGATVKTPRVPAFTIETAIPMWWNGLCLNAGANFVDVARFRQLPLRTRRAVQEHVRDGAFVLSGFASAVKALEAAQSAAVKQETAEEKKAREEAQNARNVSAAELGDLETEAKAEEAKSKAKRTRKKTEDPGSLTS